MYYAIQLTDINGNNSYFYDQDKGLFSSIKDAVDYFQQKTNNYSVDYFIADKTTPFLVNSDVGVIDCSFRWYFRRLPYRNLSDVYLAMIRGETLKVGTRQESFHTYTIVEHNPNYICST